MFASLDRQPHVLPLAVPIALRLQVTREQFAHLAAANRELHLERSAQGALIVSPPTGWETGERNGKLLGELYLWWRSTGEPGKIFDSSTGFTLPNGAIRSPDASWVSAARWRTLTGFALDLQRLWASLKLNPSLGADATKSADRLLGFVEPPPLLD